MAVFLLLANVSKFWVPWTENQAVCCHWTPRAPPPLLLSSLPASPISHIEMFAMWLNQGKPKPLKKQHKLTQSFSQEF